jgi:transportin-1
MRSHRLSIRTEYLQQHMEPICQFILTCTADTHNADVALEACEFWLTFASLDEDACTSDMVDTVAQILSHLVPVLLRDMVYLPEQQEELKYRNQMDHETEQSTNKPVFHKVKSKGRSGDGGDDEDDDDDDDFDDDEGNSWTLRKCAAASLDCLAGLYGPDGILPPLLPALQEGLSSSDPWIQEASILALGAIAEGCGEAMAPHMSQLHPYLMDLLQMPEGPQALPQVKCIAAWTIGRYATWAVEQVQSGVQADLLARMTEVFLIRLGDQNRRSQVSCCSAFGVVVEQAGDLMIPYLEPTLASLNNSLQRYEGRSLLNLFDVLGIMADFVGPAIGEGNLPAIYVPTLLKMWDIVARQDPTDRTLVPLLECLASITVACGMNYQPYALETFDNAMAMIESVTLHLTACGEMIENDEDADPIVCATDVLDGLVEGLGHSFPALLASSKRYGQVFDNVLIGLVRHEVPGVRMSGFAVVGDLARNAPSVLEPALFELLKESISNLDPSHPTVCNNAVWAIGEICLRCKGNPAPLVPVAQNLVQSLIALLMGNGVSSGGVGIPGLPENAATTTGRLAKVDPNFVAVDLPRFLLGWCDGMARIHDATERRDAFEGFIKALYANPSAIQSAASKPADAISSVLFAIVSWHMPENFDPSRIATVEFQPFPATEPDLGEALRKLLQDIKSSATEDTWIAVESQVPVNVRILLREMYQV